AIEVRLEGDEAADSVFSEQLFDGEKVAVPAAVVEWNNEQALLLGEVDDGACVGAGRREWLVDDDVLAGFERFAGESEVRLIRRGDDDELDGFIGKEIVERAVDADAGVSLRGFIALALQDGDKVHPRHGAHKRGMKDAASEAVSNNANSDFPSRHVTLSQFLLKQDTCGGSGRNASPCGPHLWARWFQPREWLRRMRLR